jgi:NitT/TauT family transport system ATP-binding protein
VIVSSEHQQGPEGKTALEVRGISKAFVSGKGPATVALRGVSLAVVGCTFVSLLGPSGCGKSTLLRILGDLEEPTAGEVTARPVGTPDRPGIAFVFQDHGLFPWLSGLALIGVLLVGVHMRAAARPAALA